MPRRAATLFLFLLVLVCYSWASEASGIWLDVPFVKQEKDGCAAASISMVMQYWSKDSNPKLFLQADPRIIQQALYSEDAEGILATAMERYFQEAGFLTFVFQGDWMELDHHLSLGRPMIVCLGGSGPTRHCLVVTGLDSEHNVVLVNDPAQRKLLKMDRADFEKSWDETGKWTLLAVPTLGE